MASIEKENHLTRPQYRPDIDGLRALAVLMVIGFHAFPNTVHGGFIGVDVFFVISGFLISTILFKNLQLGHFSFAEFYARRIQRIFPALILVLFVCLIYGWFILFSNEYKQLGMHIAGGAVFIDNFLFWHEAGYFDNSAMTKPLLHLWSLGVEEQFYLTWPVLIWAAWKKKLNLLTLAILIGAASFILNVCIVDKHTAAAFYAPMTRFWELMCGSVLAWLATNKHRHHRIYFHKIDRWLGKIIYSEPPQSDGDNLLNLISIIGFVLLVVGLICLHKDIPYPGFWGLLPVFATVLFIAAGQQAIFNRYVLSNRLAVCCGLISYPLYMWHYPLLSFATIIEGDTPRLIIRVEAVLAAFFLAWVTYVLIEKPIRFGKSGRNKTAILIMLLSVIGIAGYFVYTNNGYEFRLKLFAPEYADEISHIDRDWQFPGYPNIAGARTDDTYGLETLGVNQNNKILFIGDSHLQQYETTVDNILRRIGYDKYSAIFLYIFDINKFPPGAADIDQRLYSDDTIKTVVFSYVWYNRYIQNSKNADEIDAGLLNVVQKFRAANKTVYLILDNPLAKELDPHALIDRKSSFVIELHAPQVISTQDALARIQPVRKRLMKIAGETGSNTIDPFDYLCNRKICPMFSGDGELLYMDGNHLSADAVQHHVDYLNLIFALPDKRRNITAEPPFH